MAMSSSDASDSEVEDPEKDEEYLQLQKDYAVLLLEEEELLATGVSLN